MTLPLSKTLDPVDSAQLGPELQAVDARFHDEGEQHPLRRWEYALALHAVRAWSVDRQAHVCYDVGGAGSPWAGILGDEVGTNVRIIDPVYKPAPCALEQAVQRHPPLADLVTCLSVLEHVEDLDRFLYHLACLVAPGGLLVITVDFTHDQGDLIPQDVYHFHWMRQRIFNPYSLASTVAYPLLSRDFLHFGALDYADHGPQVYDYTFASLVLQKRA